MNTLQEKVVRKRRYLSAEEKYQIFLEATMTKASGNGEEYSMVLKETDCPDPFRVAALNVYRDIDRGKLK